MKGAEAAMQGSRDNCGGKMTSKAMKWLSCGKDFGFHSNSNADLVLTAVLWSS